MADSNFSQPLISHLNIYRPAASGNSLRQEPLTSITLCCYVANITLMIYKTQLDSLLDICSFNDLTFCNYNLVCFFYCVVSQFGINKEHLFICLSQSISQQLSIIRWSVIHLSAVSHLSASSPSLDGPCVSTSAQTGK